MKFDDYGIDDHYIAEDDAPNGDFYGRLAMIEKLTDVVLAIQRQIGSDEALPSEHLVEMLLFSAPDSVAQDKHFRGALSILGKERISRGALQRRRKIMKKYISAIDTYVFLSEHIGPQGLFAQIQCSKCGATDNKRLKSKETSPEHVLIPGWRRAGWTFRKGDKETQCPSCSTSRAPDKPMQASILEQQAIRENGKRMKEAKERPPVSPQEPALTPVAYLPTAVQPGRSEAERKAFVERLAVLSEDEQSAILKKEGVRRSIYSAWKRRYLEGRYGTLEVPVSMHAIKAPFEFTETPRQFSKAFKKAVVAETQGMTLVECVDYLRHHALTEKLYSSWKKKYAPMQTSTKDIPVNTPMPIAMDPKIQFQLFTLLQTHFDVDRRQYRDGWSDERCAKELSIGVAYVERVRVEVLGPTEDPVLVELRRDITALHTKMDSDLKDLRELEKTLKDEYDSRIEALSDRVAALEVSHNA